MAYKNIVELGNLKDKKVLVRVDFNVPLDNGIVQDTARIKNIGATIEFLQKAQAKIILISHLGKTTDSAPRQSLRCITDILSSTYNCNTVFVDDCLHKDAASIIASSGSNDIILLENLRFYREEEECNLEFAKQLASLADVYINEAFSTSHRAHASICAVPKFLPHALGLSFVREIGIIDDFFQQAGSPRMAIVGGKKLWTKIKLLKKLVSKVDKLALGGGIAGAFMAFTGHKALKIFNQKDYDADIRELIDNASKNNCELIFPTDYSALIGEGETFEHTVIYDDSHASVFDIGPESVELIKRHINECATILWNGPLGLFEKSPFDFGTKALAEEVAELSRNGKVYSIVGGGDTYHAMKKFGLEKDFTHLSTAGGAFLAYIEGSELPGLAAM
ncbi:MAG: phosphoglycerate kinase [Holosporaceae bacterium]|jgi:phosphoglycerate kinase|nr:phosphoglycerate kinase [Holosporaceae bacterium]